VDQRQRCTAHADHIQNNHIRLDHWQQCDKLLKVGDGGDHAQVWGGREDGQDAIADDGVVIRNDDRDWLW